ncbi:MAG: hypothetical protein ACOX8K_05325 [Lachnospiraceae bacterium]|jgi:hypothetical protein
MVETMKRLDEILKQVSEKAETEMDKLNRVLNLSEIDDSELKDDINEMISVLRILLKETPSDEITTKIAGRLGKETAEKIVSIAEQSMEYYYAMGPLRKMEGEKSEQVSNIILSIFGKYILRYEKEFFLSASGYGLRENELEEIARSLDILISFYIQNHYSRKMIIGDLKDETGLGDETVNTIADLIEENYQKLQINEIMDRLRYLDNKIMELKIH